VSNLYGSVTSVDVTLAVVAAMRPSSPVNRRARQWRRWPGLVHRDSHWQQTVRYQWWKDGSLLSGKTNNSFSIAAIQTNDAPVIFVIVTNNFGSVTSGVATLTVLSSNAPPSPASRKALLVTSAKSVSFSVTANGTARCGYNGGRMGMFSAARRT